MGQHRHRDMQQEGDHFAVAVEEWRVWVASWVLTVVVSVVGVVVAAAVARN